VDIKKDHIFDISSRLRLNLMHKILSSAILFIFLCFCFACKKSSNDTDQGSITGKWNLQKSTSAQYFNGVLQTTPPLAPVTASIQFNSNGTFIDTYSSQGIVDTTTGHFTLSGAMLAFSVSNSKGNGPGAPTPTPFSLFFAGALGDTPSVTSQITKLAGNEMVVHAEITATPNDGYKEVVDEYYIR
jgi:hypothetical protein